METVTKWPTEQCQSNLLLDSKLPHFIEEDIYLKYFFLVFFFFKENISALLVLDLEMHYIMVTTVGLSEG